MSQKGKSVYLVAWEVPETIVCSFVCCFSVKLCVVCLLRAGLCVRDCESSPLHAGAVDSRASRGDIAKFTS